MKVKEFNNLYNYAKKKNIIESNCFNSQGWIWLNLTKMQSEKMYNLMISQGAKEEIEEGTNRKYIQLSNGLMIYKIY